MTVTVEEVVIFGLVAIVVFLIWERFHYRHRVSRVYDSVIGLTTGLDSRFELKSHADLRRLYSLDAIIDDIEKKLELLGGSREPGAS